MDDNELPDAVYHSMADNYTPHEIISMVWARLTAAERETLARHEELPEDLRKAAYC